MGTMEKGQSIDKRPDKAAGNWRIVHRGDRRAARSSRPTSAAYSALIALLCINVPDIANLLPEHWNFTYHVVRDGAPTVLEMPARWVVWLAITQLSLAVLCIAIVRAPRNFYTRVIWMASASWFCLQTVDELMGGNFFPDGAAEYLIQAAYALGILMP